ncbi:E3 ubiquitin-protein ligase RNF4 isoform X1 [Dermochelys coriacea]|uniref:E3 ubiquitin-protein ligase RNF4 isoform X1 n=1 Tax=Dermochelys coriacea TaxID=27794 RepID=UPI0018E6F42F|nr:E3 ubiquitin-protein ligase RNF4 isoform X1 [Dermochelys coriacea]XP_038255568.1 E3 ubiquitin-protein ligase RNF4 isoform X1 [Dermochelys coriacea]XP_038255570.1 E3 ubiquitin-protein ligase RNF4 isoform X1 [Dermochelys coriacea]XP_038255575.1 E3 ubiquitin-protein ligase RNF4 isoform X1 [Dermochelys coriacea]XP_043368505.1 E3 ubiquitin-protein ligase RNF4 isoform X1 [Dermochelys coriacea]XP_043368506.1 E3 ubiquitin-protein ligase RNF4 isoform X1 [Dermochelys coriacea]XP_043368507.1 E3 ubiqu
MVSVPLTFFCILYSRNSMSTTQRKRRGGAINSRQTRKRNRLVTSATEMASEAEPIELEESAGEEVVDLTCESSEPVVVDLTHSDSVVIVEENQRRNLGLRSQRQSDSCVLSSDDEDESRDNDVYVTNKVSEDLETLEDETASSRLYKVDDLSCQPNVAMSSVVSASVTPLEMLTLAQLVGKNSITNSTIQFIYKHFEFFSGQPQLDLGENVMHL